MRLFIVLGAQRLWLVINGLPLAEEVCDVSDFSGYPIGRQALQKDLPIPLPLDSRVQQHQRAAILERPNQASEPLLQR